MSLHKYDPDSVDITADDLGLGDVDNTSDADKPVSTAQATAIALVGRSFIEDATVADVTDIVNTTTEKTAASLTLVGGSVAAGDVVRLVVIGDLLNNSGGAVLYTFRCKIGTTTALATAAGSFASNANRRKVRIEFEILMETATAQRCSGTMHVGLSGSTFAAFQSANSAVGYGTAAENTATDKAIALTVQMDTAALLADFVPHGSWLHVLKKN